MSPAFFCRFPNSSRQLKQQLQLFLLPKSTESLWSIRWQSSTLKGVCTLNSW